MPGSSVVDLRSSYGAGLIGFIVSTVLFGFTLAQAWMYFWNYWNKDTKALKLFVAFITVTDIFHTIIVIYSFYWYLVINFGNLETLAANKWFMAAQGNIGGVYSTAIQAYYARQIYVVSQNIIPPIIILILLILGNVVAYSNTALTMTSTQLNSGFRLAFGMWGTRFGMGACVVVDVLVAGMMCWALYRKKTGFARTDSMIMTLMAYTIHSGLLTSVLGIAMTISYSLAPNSMVTLAFFFQMSKCYVISVLAMLNSRDYVRDRSASATDSENMYNLTSLRIAPPSEDLFESKAEQVDVAVVVRRSIASDNARDNLDKSDHDVVHTFEVPNVGTTVTSRRQSRTSLSSV